MPRTIDHIMATHAAAGERRKAGEPIWDRKMDIKRFLKADPDNGSDEHAAWVANKIGALLRARLPATFFDWTHEDYDCEIDEIVDALESLRPDSFADDENYTALDDLNVWLDELYDWADINRVWLGA